MAKKIPNLKSSTFFFLQEGQEVEMTRPVSTHHAVKEQREGGDLEVQEMCFYIPQEHQANPPQPLDTSPVYVHTR